MIQTGNPVISIYTEMTPNPETMKFVANKLLYPGKSIDQNEEFSEWSMSELRNHVELVRRFDQACDEIRDNFIELIRSCKVVEEVVMIPKTVKRIECCRAS